MKKIVLCLLASVPAMWLRAEEEMFRYADFEQWITRSIKESILVGGNTQTLYEVGPEGTFDGARAFTNQGGSPWANSRHAQWRAMRQA